jgi:uncharacterized protein (UPF0264 family)
MTAMLASVRTLQEAWLALELGADLIDLKEPSRGALGALDHAAVRVMVGAIGGRRPVSATIGDQPEMEPRSMLAAVGQMAGTGVDYIKIGFFAHRRARECVRALAGRARATRLIAVVLADEPWTFDSVPSREAHRQHLHLPDLLDEAAASGFAGAMLDTGTKDGRSLRDWRDAAQLACFVDRARGAGLLTGLAGSLGERDVPPLAAVARPNKTAGKVTFTPAFGVVKSEPPMSSVRACRMKCR